MTSFRFKILYHLILSLPSIDATTTMQEIRALFEKLMSYFPPDPDVQFQEMKFGELNALKCSAPGVKEDKVILFFHGGAYEFGTNSSHRDLMGRLSKACHMPVIGLDYRLAPENPFPAALEDALFCYKQLLESYDPSRIILSGPSAGGGLTLALMLLLKREGIPLPRAAVCISPWVDLALTGKTIQINAGKDILPPERLEITVDLYCGDHDRKDPLVSPIYGDLSGFPPLLIQVGDQELLLDEVVLFAEKAKKQKVAVDLEIWPGMFHTWQLFAHNIPEGRQAIEKIGNWVLNLT